MSGDEKRRRKLPPWWEDELFQSQFEGVRRMIEELMEQLSSASAQEMFESDSKMLEDLLRELQDKPMIWGFSVTLGPEGRVQLNPFGNLSTEGSTPSVKNEREPLIEVIEQDGAIIIVAELPGVQKEDIQITNTGTQVTIRVNGPERKYYKTIDLPTPCQRTIETMTYANGILEVRLPTK
jgi:HSP20 family protein